MKHFTVKGTKIFDPAGDEYLIKGVNVNGPGWCFPRDTIQDAELITETWKFNTVRVCAAIGWDWCKDFNKELDPIINAFTKRKIVSILEVHDYTGIYPPQEDYKGDVKKVIPSIERFKEWWIDKANRFKDNPYVWFNIMNEPGAGCSKESADNWLKIHSILIETIRSNGAENIIVLDEHDWGQGGGYTRGASSYDSAIIRMGKAINEKYQNIVFSLHVYDRWKDGKKRFDQYFDDAKERELCVILGEYGVGRESEAHLSAVKDMLNSAIPKNIGRLYWAWDDKALPLTTDLYGWSIDKKDGEKPGNLTWVGEMIWLDNRGLLTVPVEKISEPVLKAMTSPVTVNQQG